MSSDKRMTFEEFCESELTCLNCRIPFTECNCNCVGDEELRKFNDLLALVLKKKRAQTQRIWKKREAKRVEQALKLESMRISKEKRIAEGEEELPKFCKAGFRRCEEKAKQYKEKLPMILEEDLLTEEELEDLAETQPY